MDSTHLYKQLAKKVEENMNLFHIIKKLYFKQKIRLVTCQLFCYLYDELPMCPSL